jgi:hypothetical protein
MTVFAVIPERNGKKSLAKRGRLHMTAVDQETKGIAGWLSSPPNRASP